MIHDPREYLRGLQQILISNSKRIGFLAGAGTSMAPCIDGKRLIPGIDDLTDIVINYIEEKEVGEEKLLSKAISQISQEIEAEEEKVNIENLLSKIIRKRSVIGGEKLCGIDRNGFECLEYLFKEKIRDKVSVHLRENFFEIDLPHYKLVRWINNVSREFPIEIFTTNYDYLFELALEKFDVPFFDGFIGSYEPFFHSNSVENDKLLNEWTKLWKIHGSLGWRRDDKDGKIIRDRSTNQDIMIYPSILKYDNSKKQPYLSFLDRLARFITSEDTVLFTTGYSFNDQHINETILTSLSKTRSSHVIAFIFEDIEDESDLVNFAINETKISIYGRRKAVIGGKLGKWKLGNETSENEAQFLDIFFDQEAAIPQGEEGEAEEFWTGEGDLKLIDFNELVDFLSHLNFNNS